MLLVPGLFLLHLLAHLGTQLQVLWRLLGRRSRVGLAARIDVEMHSECDLKALSRG